MTEMEERVARALVDELRGMLKCEGSPAILASAAHAAIEATREPTLDMLQAGHRAARQVRVSGTSGMTLDAQIRAESAREFAAYTAMIDAALSE